MVELKNEPECRPRAGEPVPIDLPLRRMERELCALAGQIAAATSRFLQLIADFDQTRGWERWGVRSCAHWLSWRCGIGLRTAHEQVRVARSLAGLPLIREAFDAGRLSYSKVRAISRVATPTSEPDLLSAALHAPAAHVERLVRGLRTAQRGTEGGPGPSPDELGLRPLPERRTRYRIGWHYDDHGDLVIAGRLAPEDGARLLAAVTRAGTETTVTESKPLPASGVPSMRPPHNLATGLVAMAEMVCDGLAAPVHAPAAEVHVTVDVDTLTKAFAAKPEADPDAVPGRIDEGPALTAACLRRLADDARISLSVLAADGRTLDVGRARRRPNQAQLRALWQRDRGCAVPGCERTRFLHAHHVRFWSHGGTTDLDNMLLLCGEHHRDLHEGGFSIKALGQQRFEFAGSRGTLLDPAPALQGSVAELRKTFDAVKPEAIVPDWDGTPVHGWAISGYLRGWHLALRRQSSSNSGSR